MHWRLSYVAAQEASGGGGDDGSSLSPSLPPSRSLAFAVVRPRFLSRYDSAGTIGLELAPLVLAEPSDTRLKEDRREEEEEEEGAQGSSQAGPPGRSWRKSARRQARPARRREGGSGGGGKGGGVDALSCHQINCSLVTESRNQPASRATSSEQQWRLGGAIAAWLCRRDTVRAGWRCRNNERARARELAQRRCSRAFAQPLPFGRRSAVVRQIQRSKQTRHVAAARSNTSQPA